MFWDIFKSSSKAIDTTANLLEKGAAGIDKLFFTEEEKSDAKKAWFGSWIDLQKILSTEGLPTAISRRILAWMITGTFLLLIVFACVVWKLDKEWAQFIFEKGVSNLSFSAGAVVTTYFAYYGINKVVETFGKGGEEKNKQ
jgi:hypothetical protein